MQESESFMRQIPEFHLIEQNVAVIEPCTEEAGAFMIDFNLFRYLKKRENVPWSQIDFKLLNERLKTLTNEAVQIQISDRLGICKITCPKWESILARSGRIVVRRVKKRELIDQAVNFLFNLLEGCLI